MNMGVWHEPNRLFVPFRPCSTASKCFISSGAVTPHSGRSARQSSSAAALTQHSQFVHRIGSSQNRHVRASERTEMTQFSDFGGDLSQTTVPEIQERGLCLLIFENDGPR